MTRVLTCLLALLIATSAPAGAAPLEGTLKKIKERGRIVIGFREDARPFSFLDEDGKPAGYSVDLCTRIAAVIVRQLELRESRPQWVPVTPEDRIELVATGRLDLECGSTTNTLGRQERVDFTHMTFVDGGSLLVAADARIDGVTDLNGKRVAVIPGTTTEPALTRALRTHFINAELVVVREHSDGLAALEAGQVDAYASDRVLLVGLLRKAKDPGKLRVAREYFSYEPYGFMLRRGDAAFRLAVNRVLSDIYRTGQISDTYRRWFGEIGAPSDLLRAMYLLHALPE